MVQVDALRFREMMSGFVHFGTLAERCFFFFWIDYCCDRDSMLTMKLGRTIDKTNSRNSNFR